MIKFLALIRDNGKGKVLNVADGELRRLVAKGDGVRLFVLGEYSDPRHAEKAVALGLKGCKRQDAGKTA